MSDIATLRIQPTAVQRLTKNSTFASGYFLGPFFNQKKLSSSSIPDKIFDHVQSPKRAPLVLIWGVRYVRFMYMYAFPCDVFTYVVPNSRASVPGHDSLLTLMSVWMNDCDCWSVSILLENCFAVFLDLLFLKHLITDRRNSIDIKCASISEHYVSTRYIPRNTESKTCAYRL